MMKLGRRGLLSGCVAVLVILASTQVRAQSHDETALWEAVRDSKDPDEYGAYLDKYPEGIYAPIAKRRISSLGRPPARVTTKTVDASPPLPPTADNADLGYPSVMHFCAAHCATWNFKNGRMGEGPYGVTIARWTADSVVLNRSDPPNQWFPNGLKAVITGRMSPEHDKLVNGKITWTFGQAGTYDAKVTWGSALDEIPGQDGPPPAPPASADHTKPAGQQSTEDSTRLIPTDDVANAEIDAGFKRWSSTWMFDRYVPGSAHATERGYKDATYVVRGMFDFIRGGGRLTIPFAASYGRTAEKYSLSNLCYNDTSSGMTDCIDPNNPASMQSRQFLGSIVLLGLVAAMSADEETCVRHYTLFGGEYFECN